MTANCANKLPDIFGSMVFDDRAMRQRLPKETYRALRNTIENGKKLDVNIANVVANAMKDWAVERGCTHFTHWFQPMTGVTAGTAGPMPMSAASAEDMMPIATPDQMPVVAVNTNSTQFTSEPVTSCVTENGPAMTAPAGMTLPSSWATTTSATPSAVRVTQNAAECFWDIFTVRPP